MLSTDTDTAEDDKDKEVCILFIVFAYKELIG